MESAPLLLFKPEKRRYRTQGAEAIRFIETFCVLGDGDAFGQPFLLRPWQKAIINKMFEVVWDERRGQWRRRYTRALLGLPSGSGKTPFAAAVGMWFLCGGLHRSPSVIVSAASKEQAGLVFGNAKVMAEESRLLKRFTETGMDSITLRGQPGRLYRVSAADGTNDGQNASCLIKDEYHEWSENRNTDAILTKATTKRIDAFELDITTAGFDKDTFCGRLYDYGKAIQRGEEVNDRFFFHWVEADESDDPDDPEAWRRVHPAVDDFMSIDAIADKRRELPDLTWQRYYFNRWTSAENSWLEAGQWDACTVAPEDAEFVPGGPIFVGWDGSAKRDSTAVVAVQKGTMQARDDAGEFVFDDDDEPVMMPRVRVLSRIWDRPRLPTGAFDEKWRVSQHEVMDYIRELSQTYQFVRGPFDPQLIALYAEDLAEEGIAMLSFPQTPTRMAEATGMLYGLIADGTLAHDGDPQLARHIANAAYEPLRTGGGRLVKGPKAKNKMDGAIALAMAVWSLTKEEEPEPPADVAAMLYV